MKKHLPINDLMAMPIGHVAALDVENLHHAKQVAEEELRRAKLLKDWIDAAIMMKYEKTAASVRSQSGKYTGIIHFNDGSYTITADAPKKIEWDQTLVKQAIQQIIAKGEDPEEYVETSYKISENKYTAWPHFIRSLFEPARVLKLGKAVYTIKAQEAA